MILDLAKIKFPEMPSKVLNVNLFGEDVELTIKPITGFALTKLSSAGENLEDICKIALQYGAGFSVPEIEAIFTYEIATASLITNEIVNLTKQFVEMQDKERKLAKKNSTMKK